MDPEWLAGLIDRHAAALELYARQWCDAPEDAVQEAFVGLAAQADPPTSPAAWLFRATRNAAINAGIADRRRRKREAEAAAETSAWFEDDPSDHRRGDIEPDAVQAALAALPPEQREVIVAHLWGGLTFEQIAELAGTSSSTAHRLYHAGLAALRERLGVPCRTSRSRPIPD